MRSSNFEIKLVLSDVDGVMTDGGLYYMASGEEFKRFHVHDGMGFLLLKEAGIKTGILTSEDSAIIDQRGAKIKADYIYKGIGFDGKLKAAKEICLKEHLTLEQVAYIGDDINCIALLKQVGFAACPYNAVDAVKEIAGIAILSKNGGNGAVREFAELILAGVK